MKTKILMAAAAAIVIGLGSCKKQTGPEGPTGAQGPAGPVLTGNIMGFISHFDLSGTKMTTNLAGDSISIDGTGKVAVTDATGSYTFSGISTGVYNFTVKRSGFGWNKLEGVQFTGGGYLYRDANISKIPGTIVSTVMAYDTIINAINYVRVRGTVPAANFVQSVIVFVGIPGNTTVNAATSSQTGSYVINIPANATNFLKNIPTTDLYDFGYASGNTAYFAAYMIGNNTNASSYADLSNNRTVYTAISANPATASAAIQ